MPRPFFREQDISRAVSLCQLPRNKKDTSIEVSGLYIFLKYVKLRYLPCSQGA